MIFTSRTYRVAIRRSIKAERFKRDMIPKSRDRRDADSWKKGLRISITHTARLQRRKRRERK